MISGKPRDAARAVKYAKTPKATDPFNGNVIMDMTGINNARLNEMKEQFKAAMDKIENEFRNLESLKIKKTKLRNKLLDIYQFLLKNPHIIL